MRLYDTSLVKRSSTPRAPQSVISDRRLVAEIRRVIAAELAGFRVGDNGRENVCLEPGCSCRFDTCGPFRAPATRCTAFEVVLLPAFPELERAYWAHLRGEDAAFKVRRCAHLRCRRRCRNDSTAFCEWHAEAREREAKRALRLGRCQVLPAAGE